MLFNHPQATPPTRVHGKIVFRETGPWCQKGRGPQLYNTSPIPSCSSISSLRFSKMWIIGSFPYFTFQFTFLSSQHPLSCSNCNFNIQTPSPFNHFLILCVCVCARAKSLLFCPTLCDPVDCSSPDSSVHNLHLILMYDLSLPWLLLIPNPSNPNNNTLE